MTGWGGSSVALGDDDARGAIFGLGRSAVGRRELGEDGQDDVGR